MHNNFSFNFSNVSLRSNTFTSAPEADDEDTDIARTFYLKCLCDKYLPEKGIDQLGLLNFFLGSHLPISPETNRMNLEESTTAVNGMICTLFKQVTSFAPVCITIDDAQWCDPTSIALMKALAQNQSDDILIVISSTIGDSQLPTMRHHIPKTVKPTQIRATLAATSAFSGLFGKVQKKSSAPNIHQLPTRKPGPPPMLSRSSKMMHSHGQQSERGLGKAGWNSCLVGVGWCTACIFSRVDN